LIVTLSLSSHSFLTAFYAKVSSLSQCANLLEVMLCSFIINDEHR